MKKIIIYLMFVFSLVACAKDDVSMKVNVNQPNFVVILPANPTTGYQWRVVEYDKSLISLSSSHYEKDANDRMGSGGKMHFTFVMQQGKTYPSSTVITFKYARPWDANEGTVKNAKIYFVK